MKNVYFDEVALLEALEATAAALELELGVETVNNLRYRAPDMDVHPYFMLHVDARNFGYAIAPATNDGWRLDCWPGSYLLLVKKGRQVVTETMSGHMAIVFSNPMRMIDFQNVYRALYRAPERMITRQLLTTLLYAASDGQDVDGLLKVLQGG